MSESHTWNFFLFFFIFVDSQLYCLRSFRVWAKQFGASPPVPFSLLCVNWIAMTVLINITCTKHTLYFLYTVQPNQRDWLGFFVLANTLSSPHPIYLVVPHCYGQLRHRHTYTTPGGEANLNHSHMAVLQNDYYWRGAVKWMCTPTNIFMRFEYEACFRANWWTYMDKDEHNKWRIYCLNRTSGTAIDPFIRISFRLFPLLDIENPNSTQ